MSISGYTLTLNKSLQFDHYGNSSYLQTMNGGMDMRATVALLDRNIKFIGVQDQGEWGASILIAGSRVMNMATK